MVLINKAINEVTVKLVYYGPGLCGKTTNLEKIYANPKLDNKGRMISMSTETDRTLFFDFMPMELGTIAGQKVRIQLYTVPGQVFYDATRKLVLRGADGVVFVADSQQSMRDANIASLDNLRTNLRVNRIDPDKIALVFQYNKRDLPNVSSIEEMNEYLQPGNAPVVEAAALNGTGVTQTLRTAIGRILDNLKKNVDATIHDAPSLRKPDMTARSGATQSSAGTPKVKTLGGNVPLPPVTPAPAAAPVVAPFPEPAIAAVADDPFSEPFDGLDASELHHQEEDLFADVGVRETEQLAEAAEDLFSEVEETVEAADDPNARLEEMLANARAMVASLEAALERARENERLIQRMLSR